jgi:glutamyl-tRNA synthetase
MKEVRTRFAPSPTGFMHIGNLRTALYAYLFAKSNGGKFILRIEDTDQQREVEGAVDKIYKTLALAGLMPDEGPTSGGAYGPYTQSERLDIYKEYAKKLVELGGAYYCFCDKERLASLSDENGIRKYDKLCLKLTKEQIEKNLAANVPRVVRQNMPTEGCSAYTDLVFGEISVPCSELEDNVLLKSDGFPTYNFANVIDDRLMQISHVMRGTEYLSSTPKYNLIYKAFGWEEPKYIHLPAIMKDKQRKLSKRFGDANFEDFLEKGYLPAAIINYIALLGWSPGNHQEKMTAEELLKLFSIGGISVSGSIFDEDKLKWLNSQYIKELTFENFINISKPYFEKSAIFAKFGYEKFAALLQTRLDYLGEIIEKVAFVSQFENYDLNLFAHQKMKTDLDVARLALPAAIDALKTLPNFDNKEEVGEALATAADAAGLKKGQLLWCVRVAATGAEVTPGGATEMLEVFGREESLSRLACSLARIDKIQ